MPINDPIRRRKVAPASLAFEANEGTRTGMTVSYQQTIVQVAQQQEDTHRAQHRDYKSADEQATKNILQSEMRAYDYVGDYMQVVEWDIAHDLTVTMATNDPIGFAQPVINCVGAQRTGAISSAAARWYHKLVKGYEGIWWYYAHMQLFVPDDYQITKATLLFFVNNTTYRVVDATDAEMTGNTSSIFADDIILSGGCHVPLNVNDEFDVRIRLDSPLGVGDGLLTFPSSVYGYVTGHREQCSRAFLGSQPTTGDEYVFR